MHHSRTWLTTLPSDDNENHTTVTKSDDVLSYDRRYPQPTCSLQFYCLSTSSFVTIILIITDKSLIILNSYFYRYKIQHRLFQFIYCICLF